MTLAIDLDGVLHDHLNPKPGRRMGLPMEGAVNAMIRLKQLGHTLIIHSVWGDRRKVIADWCDYYSIPYDDITNIKPEAAVYLDDKALAFTTWDETMTILEGL